MARLPKNSSFNGVRGRIGEEIVFKTYSYGTVISKYPDMSNQVASDLQNLRRSKMRDAVAYAQKIIHDPVLKAKFPMPAGKHISVYHAALSAYMKGNIWVDADM